VVDQAGKIAWIGHPMMVEAVLEQVLAGKWDTAAAAHDYKLNSVDMDLIPHMNTFMTAGDYKGAQLEIDKLLKDEPGLRYKTYVGHYTFTSYCNLDPAKAVEFGKQWIAASPDSPPYSDIVAVTVFMHSTDKNLCLFAADCVDTEVKLYGDDSNKSFLLDQQAECYLRADEPTKALAAAQSAVDHAKRTPGYPAERLKEAQQKLAQISATTNPGGVVVP
jgi:hypothetical protein